MEHRWQIPPGLLHRGRYTSEPKPLFPGLLHFVQLNFYPSDQGCVGHMCLETKQGYHIDCNCTCLTIMDGELIGEKVLLNQHEQAIRLTSAQVASYKTLEIVMRFPSDGIRVLPSALNMIALLYQRLIDDPQINQVPNLVNEKLRSELEEAKQKLCTYEDASALPRRLSGLLTEIERRDELDADCLHDLATQMKAARRAIKKRLAQGRLCPICLSREKSMLLLPCRHVPCCQECRAQLRSCPQCRSAIEESHRIYQ